jgi:hypothetical protein
MNVQQVVELVASSLCTCFHGYLRIVVPQRHMPVLWRMHTLKSLWTKRSPTFPTRSSSRAPQESSFLFSQYSRMQRFMRVFFPIRICEPNGLIACTSTQAVTAVQLLRCSKHHLYPSPKHARLPSHTLLSQTPLAHNEHHGTGASLARACRCNDSVPHECP